MKNIDVERKIYEALLPFLDAAKKHKETVGSLCEKIEGSNGQICKALIGKTKH